MEFQKSIPNFESGYVRTLVFLSYRQTYALINYKLFALIAGNANYVEASKETTFVITRLGVAIPQITGSYTYSGEEITVTLPESGSEATLRLLNMSGSIVWQHTTI